MLQAQLTPHIFLILPVPVLKLMDALTLKSKSILLKINLFY